MTPTVAARDGGFVPAVRAVTPDQRKSVPQKRFRIGIVMRGRKPAVHMAAETPDHLVALRDLRDFISTDTITPVASLCWLPGGVMRISLEFPFEFSVFRNPYAKLISFPFSPLQTNERNTFWNISKIF